MRARELLVVDRDLHEGGAPAAVLDRPMNADPPAARQKTLPFPKRLRFLEVGRDVDVGRLVGGKPRAELIAEGEVG